MTEREELAELFEFFEQKSKICEQHMEQYRPMQYRRNCLMKKYPHALRRQQRPKMAKDGDSKCIT